MLELLSPAGSPESVIAAVQNGADAVYMGLGDFNARRGARNFTNEEFEKAVRYCRVRGCKVYVTMNTLVDDREMKQASELARYISDVGADAILVQDLGLLSVLRRCVPDLPLHASTQMSIHSLAGAEAAAELGLSRVVLARELSFEQIKYITERSPIETEIFVHGALCFCHSGQCYMSSLIGRRSGNRGMCAQPCRMEYSLGGRMEDTHPLSLKDNCLVSRLREIEDAGVACAKIEGRMKRPEYTAIVTNIYSKIIRERREPTTDELTLLEAAFSRDGFTQGYFNGDRADMFGTRSEGFDRETEKLFLEVRKNYIDGEMRRVPVKIYTVVNKREAVKAAAVDDDGHKVILRGYTPKEAVRQPVTEEAVNEQMRKTGGTPYLCTEAQSRVENGIYLPVSAINELRRSLLSTLSEERAKLPKRTSLPMPELPRVMNDKEAEPVTIYQVRTGDQLSAELCELRPDYLYVPVLEMRDNFDAVSIFRDIGTTCVAVLPRVITDEQVPTIKSALMELRERGIKQALIGNLGHILLARNAGMQVRADFGMNTFNSFSLDLLKKLGFLSATASFELRMAQIRDLAKFVNTEMIVYGRLPLMVSDQCVISRAAGRCNCQVPTQLSDRKGLVFPVVREYEHRNVIYNAHKLFLADKLDDVRAAGVWGMRLMFTTESARECYEVAKRYKGEGEFRPNVLTRGLYYRGVD